VTTGCCNKLFVGLTGRSGLHEKFVASGRRSKWENETVNGDRPTTLDRETEPNNTIWQMFWTFFARCAFRASFMLVTEMRWDG
jgi:hypothetical protein